MKHWIKMSSKPLEMRNRIAEERPQRAGTTERIEEKGEEEKVEIKRTCRK